MKNIEFAFDLLDEIENFQMLDRYSNIYIYGAGKVGLIVLKYLRNRNLSKKIKAFVVSNLSEKNDVDGVPIHIFNKTIIRDDDVVILAVTNLFRQDLLSLCQKRNIKNTIEIDCFDEPFMYFYGLKEGQKRNVLEKWYKEITGEVLNLDSPNSFNEKIQWIKLFENDQRKTELSDKYLVRSYVKRKVGEEYLIPLLGVWNSFDEIEWDELPEAFILKCTHGSGMNEIVKSKHQVDVVKLKRKFDRWGATDFSLHTLERHYHSIVPRIIAEKLISDNQGCLLDYKFWCFDGQVKLVQVDIGRFSDHRRNLYTPSWDYLPYEIMYPSDRDAIFEKPPHYEEMMSVAERLAEGFNHVRVDLYNCDGRIFFGEMTFTHGSGVEKFVPYELGNEVGNWLRL